jgi:hypothetical protein
MSEPNNSHLEPRFFQLSFQSPWAILRPRVFRFLEEKYVDEFFDSGKLRLSSFSRFAKHEDEERKDAAEGRSVSFQSDGMHTLVASSASGHDCYVLCGTTSSSERISEGFGQAAIVIGDTTEFAGVVARALSNFSDGIEGHCIYNRGRRIDRAREEGSIQEMLDKHKNSDGTLNMDILRDAVKPVVVEQMFLKDERYAHQLEYRILWRCSKVLEFIDIEVPEARRFCWKFKR